MPTLLIAGDVCPIERNRPLFAAGQVAPLLNDLEGEFRQADLAIANLECPLIETPSPIRKTGPVFGVESECINGIRNAGFDVLNLANNHSLDHGAPGLANTIRVCSAAGIATVGAGDCLESAGRLLLQEVGGVRIAILGMAEREFSIASKNGWGANPLDLINFVRIVRRHRETFDYLVVLVHGGNEFQPISPRLQNTCRFLIEMGANAVIVQHPHCVGGFENYQNGWIVYGQGAFLMDEGLYRDLKAFHEGFLVKLNVTGPGCAEFSIVPFSQADPETGARRMKPEIESCFRRSLEERCKQILDPGMVESQWLRFCQEGKHRYMSGLLGHHRIVRRLNARGFVERNFYSARSLLGVRNNVCCESHREVLETLFDANLVPLRPAGPPPEQGGEPKRA